MKMMMTMTTIDIIVKDQDIDIKVLQVILTITKYVMIESTLCVMSTYIGWDCKESRYEMSQSSLLANC